MRAFHVAPRSIDTYAPRSVPAQRRCLPFGSSRTVFTGSVGRPEAIEVQVAPKSVDFQSQGAKSSLR